MALYAYAVVEGGRGSLPAVAGVNGAYAQSLVAAGAVAAVVSEVDVADFEGAGLERNAADTGWLESAVRAHERVVEGLLGTEPVVPMRFGSIFSSAAALTTMLTEHSRELARLLDRVRGRDEWGVKLHVDLAAVADELVPRVPAGSDGRAYLERRRAELGAAERAGERAALVGHTTHEALAAVADDAARLRPKRPPAGGVVALNAAYLVPAAGRDAFMGLIGELQRAHGPAYVLEVSGPWPPYSFTAVDVAGPRS